MEKNISSHLEIHQELDGNLADRLLIAGQKAKLDALLLGTVITQWLVATSQTSPTCLLTRQVMAGKDSEVRGKLKSLDCALPRGMLLSECLDLVACSKKELLNWTG